MKLRKPASLISPRLGGGHEACESCGEPFVCGASLAACWCSEIELSEATRAELRQRFRRCLCRACLEKYAARDAQAPEAGAP
jgi:hypothetical protein